MNKYIKDTDTYTAEYQALVTKVSKLLYEWGNLEYGDIICEELLDIVLEYAKGEV